MSAIPLDLLTDITTCTNYIGPAANTPALPFLINAASQMITESCNRPFWLAGNAANPIQEYISGTGDPFLPLTYWPVQSITNIYYNNAGYWGQTSGGFGPSTTLLVQGNDYVLQIDSNSTPMGSQVSKSAYLVRINGVWDSVYLRDGGMLASYGVGGWGNVQANYVYGYLTIPSDVQWAATLLVARLLALNKGRLVNSLSFEEFSTSWDNWLLHDRLGFGVLAGEINSVLSKYRIMPIQIIG